MDQTQADRAIIPHQPGFVYERSSSAPPTHREAVLCGRMCDLNIAFCIVAHSSGKWVLLCVPKWEDDLLLIGPEPVSPGLLCVRLKRISPCESSCKACGELMLFALTGETADTSQRRQRG